MKYTVSSFSTLVPSAGALGLASGPPGATVHAFQLHWCHISADITLASPGSRLPSFLPLLAIASLRAEASELVALIEFEPFVSFKPEGKNI